MFEFFGVLVAFLAAIVLPTTGIALLVSWKRAQPAGFGAVAISGLALPGAVVAFVFSDVSRTNGVGYGDAMGLAVLLISAAAITPVTLLTAFIVIRRMNKRGGVLSGSTRKPGGDVR